MSPLRQEEIVGLKARIVATLDHREVALFDVDMVEEDPPAGGLNRRPPYIPFQLAGVPTPAVLLYPVEDHLADKLSAMGKTWSRGDGTVMTSTRYRDLADLALLAASAPVAAAPLLAALEGPTAEVALAVAKPLVNPALAGTARGTWDPVAASWRR
jgi:hypothetical protein